MAFINEYIPQKDIVKYDFERLNRRTKETSGTEPSDFWTIDRSADIWLRCFYTESDHTAEQGGFTGISFWDYYWKGALMLVKVLGIEAGGRLGEHCWGRKRLLAIDIPFELEIDREAILKDLEASFIGYKDGGVLSGSTSYSFVLEV
jgi:hypothetical protein